MPEENKITEAQRRKRTPLGTFLIEYFPEAQKEKARLSFAANEQHNPGEHMHWAREKSQDHVDCLLRHLFDHAKNPVDTDGQLHLAKVAWRADAMLQLYLEQ